MASDDRPSRLKRALRLDRSFTGRELLLAWAALAVVATVTFLPHILHGGFYLDDWSNAAATLDNLRGTGFGDVISYYADVTIFRPGLVIYVPLTYWVFGLHLWMFLAWAAFLALLVAWFLYAVLRKLGLPWIHALAIGGMTLVYPWYDSTRFWATGAQITVATAFALAGLWASLVGLERDSWRRQIPAMVLLGLSILTYEIATPAIAAFGLLYVWRFGWKRARWVWAADLGVVLACGGWVLAKTPRTEGGISGYFHHLWMIVKGGAEIVARTLIPVGQARVTLGLVLLGIVFAAALFALWRMPRSFGRGAGVTLPGWLMLGGCGLALTVLGWVVFVPADPYYTPSIYGITNRVNGIGGIGAILIVYAAFGAFGTLLTPLFRRRSATLSLVPVLVLVLLVGIGYLSVIRRHVGLWNSASTAERVAMDKIKATYPTLPPGTVLYTTEYPAYQALGIPILSAPWDLNGMVEVEYGDGRLAAYPLLPNTKFKCEEAGLAVVNAFEPTAEEAAEVTPYASVRVLSFGKERAFRPRDKAECLRQVAGLEPGPIVVQEY